MPTNQEMRYATKLRLCDALVELMKENAYEDIAVMDISRRAGVAHSTYCRYFKSKEEMIYFWVEHKVGQYLVYANLPTGQDHHITHRNITRVFQLFKEHESFVLGCVNASLGQCIRNPIAKFLQNNYRNRAEGEPDGEGRRRGYILGVYASALFAAAVDWLRGGGYEEPEEMADLLYVVFGSHI